MLYLLDGGGTIVVGKEEDVVHGDVGSKEVML